MNAERIDERAFPCPGDAGDADAPASARVAAAKALLGLDPTETKPGNGKARPSKKAVAARAADNAGVDTPWGSDLAWPDGRRPQ